MTDTEAARREVATWPRLDQAQRDRLADLLAPGAAELVGAKAG